MKLAEVDIRRLEAFVTPGFMTSPTISMLQYNNFPHFLCKFNFSQNKRVYRAQCYPSAEMCVGEETNRCVSQKNKSLIAP